jgi:hypothetical protein
MYYTDCVTNINTKKPITSSSKGVFFVLTILKRKFGYICHPLALVVALTSFHIFYIFRFAMKVLESEQFPSSPLIIIRENPYIP